MEAFEKALHQNKTSIITEMINTFHYKISSCHDATHGYLRDHFNAAYLIGQIGRSAK